MNAIYGFWCFELLNEFMGVDPIQPQHLDGTVTKQLLEGQTEAYCIQPCECMRVWKLPNRLIRLKDSPLKGSPSSAEPSFPDFRFATCIAVIVENMVGKPWGEVCSGLPSYEVTWDSGHIPLQ